MTSFQIKLIAIITMVIDHVGLFFFPDIIFFRMIGRISFPLFAYLIANGAHYTKNINKYIGRMFVFALISQTPYYLAHKLIDADRDTLNVLFTFSLALVAISFSKKYKNTIVSFVVVASTAVIAHLLKVDYGIFGILLITSFYLFFANNKMKILSFVFLALCSSVIPAMRGDSLNISAIDLAPLLGMFSLIFILFYNNKQGPKAKYLFYIFYPLQYLIIYLVRSLL